MKYGYLILLVIWLGIIPTHAQAPQPHIIMEMGRGEVGDIRLNPTGDILAVATNIGVWLYDFPSLTDRQFLPSATVWDVAWLPNGIHLLARIPEGILVWNIHTATIVYTVPVASIEGFEADYRLLIPFIGEWSLVQWASPHGQYALRPMGNTLVLENTQSDQPIATLYEDFRNKIGFIRRLEWSPDNQYFFFITDRYRLTVIHIATQTIQDFYNSPFWMERAIWSPDSRYVTGGSDEALSVWDVTTGDTVFLLGGGHAGEILWSEWSGDGRYLLTAGRDSLVVVWDMHTGTLANRLIQHASEASDMEWSPDGTKIATSNGGWQAMIWDAEHGQVLHHLIGHRFGTFVVTWSPDSRCLASMSDGGSQGQNVIIWDSTTGAIQHNLVMDWLYQLNWSATEGCLPYGDDGEPIVISQHHYDMTTRFNFDIFTWAENRLSPDGRYIFHTYFESVEHIAPLEIINRARFDYKVYKVMTIWDTQTGEKIHTLRYPTYNETGAGHAYWSSDSTQLAISGLFPNTILIVTLQSPEIQTLPTIAHQFWWSPDNRRLATVDSANEMIDIWDIPTNTRLYRISSIAHTLAWSPDSTQLATEYDGVITIWAIP